MKIKIPKNKHYPFPCFFIPIPIWIRKNWLKRITRKFKFTESCLYDLKDSDQFDTNKLFGFSIGFHHNTSFRFGWRVLLDEKKIEILSDEYHNGKRQEFKSIAKLDINKWYIFQLSYFQEYDKESSIYIINDYERNDCSFYSLTNEFSLKKKSGLGYLLGFYFGGNRKAPQDIIVYKK